MNMPNLLCPRETDALRDDLRPSERSPRPIPCPETPPRNRFGGWR